jgi:hypothetical protein
MSRNQGGWPYSCGQQNMPRAMPFTATALRGEPRKVAATKEMNEGDYKMVKTKKPLFFWAFSFVLVSTNVVAQPLQYGPAVWKPL